MSAPYVLTGTEVETRVVDPATGGKKGRKRAQLGALDPVSLYTLAEVAGMGADKYSAHNYLKGYAWSLSYDALQRHLLKFQMGEDNDRESGLPHLAHAAWHCLTLLSFQLREVGTDDRPPAHYPHDIPLPDPACLIHDVSGEDVPGWEMADCTCWLANHSTT